MNNCTAKASSPVLANDIEIKIWPRCWVHWFGTKAQLIAEGLVGEGFAFPQKYAEVCFVRDGFNFAVRRNCPRGLKGARHLHPDVDHWLVRSSPVREPRISAVIHDLHEQLAKQIYLESSAGQAQFFKAFTARTDKAFQSFMTAATGIMKKGRSA